MNRFWVEQFGILLDKMKLVQEENGRTLLDNTLYAGMLLAPDKLMFRIRVRVDPERLRGHAEVVRSGLPGVAYVLTDPAATWPAALQRTAAR